MQFIRPSVIHLMRGQIFNLSEKTFFTFGGARSHDISDGILENNDPQLKVKIRQMEKRNLSYRVNHISWWAEEMPDDNEKTEGLRTLDAAGWKVDYIITHCCSTELLAKRFSSMQERDPLTDYFSVIEEKCDYKHCFFGHYHMDEDWGEKETCLYDQIVELTDDEY